MLTSVVIMLALVSALILAHELGHFWAAKWAGVRVERFGFGLPMGPTLWRKKFGQTEYCLHLLLFGGYVAFPDDSPESTIAADSTERFENQSIFNRAVIASAGIIVNAIMGWGLMIWVLLAWGVPSMQIGIEHPIALLQPKQTLSSSPELSTPYLAINQQTPARWQSHALLAQELLTPLLPMLNPSDTVQTLVIIDPIGKSQQILYPSPAYVAGITGGEKILAINNEPITGYFSEPLLSVTKAISKSGNSVSLTLQNPKTGATEVRTVKTPVAGKIGIQLSSEEVFLTAPSLWWTVTRTATLLGSVVIQNFEALGGMVSGQIDASQLAGPVKIIDTGAKLIASDGIQKGLILTAIISVILAVMNLLPIPPLDGCHLLYLLIEAIKGSPVNRQFQERLSQLGFVGMMALMVFILWNDIRTTFF
ncbi:MAG: RIP metalloprotease RseP [Vampirovibrionales bacterium]|nr:RIP metalloprotease RseP [Vampirovibrionales bacterium]